MAQDWLADVRKYAADADETVVAAIVKYLGIALRKVDSSLVSFTDKKETDRVRENFLKKKLGLAHDDATLDAAIAGVGDRMKGDRTKNRVTVYYLLAEHFGLLSLFGGIAGASTGVAAGLAGSPAGDGGAIDTNGGVTSDEPGSAPLAAAALGAAGVAAATPAAAAVPPPPEPVSPPPPPAAPVAPQAAYSPPDEPAGGGGMGWLPWLLLALLLLALIFFGFRYCSKQEAAVAPATDQTAISESVAPPDAAATAAAIPEGAGVIAAEREGKPMLTVYFDTGKSLVSNDLSAAASAVKTYVDANPAATLAVSGYNDPTGNAAANAELSKNRAQSVKAALEKLGIAADKVVLEKPAETTTVATDNAAARRVEVTIRN